MNALRKAQAATDWVKLEALSALARLISPFVPHLAEECWAHLHKGDVGLICDAPWPGVDRTLLKSDTVILGVQVNGKRRTEIEVGADDTKEEIETFALDHDDVKKHTDGKTIRKVIVVPGRIVNIVAN